MAFSDSCLRKTSFPSTVCTTVVSESVRSKSSERSCANNALTARISCKQEQEVLIFSCSYPRKIGKCDEVEKRCFFSFRLPPPLGTEGDLGVLFVSLFFFFSFFLKAVDSCIGVPFKGNWQTFGKYSKHMANSSKHSQTAKDWH